MKAKPTLAQRVTSWRKHIKKVAIQKLITLIQPNRSVLRFAVFDRLWVNIALLPYILTNLYRLLTLPIAGFYWNITAAHSCVGVATIGMNLFFSVRQGQRRYRQRQLCIAHWSRLQALRRQYKKSQ